MGEPCGRENVLTLVVVADEFVGEFGHWFVEKALVNDGGKEAVAGRIQMDSVFREGKFWVLFALFLHVGVDGGVGVYDRFDVVFLGKDPAGVGSDDVAVVVLVDLGPVELFRTDGNNVLGGLGIEGWRGDEDELGTGSVDGVDELLDALLIGLKPVHREGVVDAIVHAVAGDHEIGFGLFKGARQAFVDVGPREGMLGLGESGDAFRREAAGDDLGGKAIEVEGGLEIDEVVAGRRDRVAEEEDAVGREEEIVGLFDAPNFFKDRDDIGVHFLERGAVVRSDVVFSEEGFGGFGEVFHLVAHGVGGSVGDAEGFIRIAAALGKVGEAAGFFGILIGLEDAGMAVTEEMVVVGVGEFVEGEVGHAHGLALEVEDVGELDRLRHFYREIIALEPG